MQIKFIKPSYEIDMLGQTGIEKLKHIEKVARLCYKTEDRITEDSYEKLIKLLVDKGHGAMLEHASFAVKFICSRDFTHELVRHRIPSFAQESQRYVGYGNAIEFIIPSWCNIEPHEVEFGDNWVDDGATFAANNHDIDIWRGAMFNSALDYQRLLNLGWRPEQARSVLPNATKTEIWINTNLREFLHIFELRASMAAAPAMRELMLPLLSEIKNKIPIVFDKCLP